MPWEKVAKKPRNIFDKGHNCELALNAAKQMKQIKLIGIGNSDIRDGNKKLILAVVWQLCRVHFLQIIGSKTEADLLKWVS